MRADFQTTGFRCHFEQLVKYEARCSTTFRFAGFDRQIEATTWKHNHRSSLTREIPLRYIPPFRIFLARVTIHRVPWCIGTFPPLFQICIAENRYQNRQEERYLDSHLWEEMAFFSISHRSFSQIEISLQWK